jgi:hypothetical protein
MVEEHFSVDEINIMRIVVDSYEKKEHSTSWEKHRCASEEVVLFFTTMRNLLSKFLSLKLSDIERGEFENYIAGINLLMKDPGNTITLSLPLQFVLRDGRGLGVSRDIKVIIDTMSFVRHFCNIIYREVGLNTIGREG